MAYRTSYEAAKIALNTWPHETNYHVTCSISKTKIRRVEALLIHSAGSSWLFMPLLTES